MKILLLIIFLIVTILIADVIFRLGEKYRLGKKHK